MCAMGTNTENIDGTSLPCLWYTLPFSLWFFKMMFTYLKTDWDHQKVALTGTRQADES